MYIYMCLCMGVHVHSFVSLVLCLWTMGRVTALRNLARYKEMSEAKGSSVTMHIGPCNCCGPEVRYLVFLFSPSCIYTYKGERVCV